jgi:hypothetical protein
MNANREFKFACSVCQQHLEADLGDVGKIVSCPTCFRSIIIPAPLTGHLARVLVRAKEANEPRTSSAKTTAADHAAAGAFKISAAVAGLILTAMVSVVVYALRH